jgi:DNA-binding CsgD family transcriptional regulator
MVTTHSEIAPMTSPTVREMASAQRNAMGVADVVGIVVHPEPGVALVLYSALDRVASPTRHERHLLSQLGLHLAAAYRLRLRPEIVHAVLSLDGKCIDRRAPAEHDAIAGTVRRIEGSRSRASQANLLELWTALVAGRYSLVSRSTGGRRHYLVLDNALASQAMRALTRREVDVLSMAARGLSTKLVAYGLGISPTAVSSALGRATSKLGLSTRIELVRLAATIIGDPRVGGLPTTLTEAESEILALLRQGLSNREIARLRSRSVNTIANQVASLLRKTESTSRRALITAAAADRSP